MFKDSFFLKSTVETLNLVWQEAVVLNPLLLLYLLGCLLTAHWQLAVQDTWHLISS